MSFVLKDSNILKYNNITNFKVMKIGNVFRLCIYFNITNKYKFYGLKKQFKSIPNFYSYSFKDGQLCATFIADEKYTDRIKMITECNFISTLRMKESLNFYNKKPGYSIEQSGLVVLIVLTHNLIFEILTFCFRISYLF